MTQLSSGEYLAQVPRDARVRSVMVVGGGIIGLDGGGYLHQFGAVGRELDALVKLPTGGWPGG